MSEKLKESFGENVVNVTLGNHCCVWQDLVFGVNSGQHPATFTWLSGLTLKLKLQYFGHLMRRAESLEKTLMLGKIEGRRRRG